MRRNEAFSFDEIFLSLLLLVFDTISKKLLPIDSLEDLCLFCPESFIVLALDILCLFIDYLWYQEYMNLSDIL